MSRPFHLETLHVDRLPGIDSAFTLPPLAPGLNLVFGPNASGKSSVIRAIDAALWPSERPPREVTVTATARDGDSEWRVHLDAGSIAVTRNGVTASALDVPAPALRHRYHLALHDLLAATETGTDFAAAIARASVGGLDLTAAAATAGFSEKPSRSMTARAEWDAARNARQEAQQQQHGLHREAARITELEQRVEEARSARDTSEIWRAAARWIAARDAATMARAELAALPEVVARLDGREAASAQSLCDDWRRNRTDWEREQQQRGQALATEQEAFPERVPDAAMREQWRALREEWREADGAVHASRMAHDEATVRERELRRAMGSADYETLGSIDAAVVGEFTTFARDAANARAEWVLADREYAALSARPPLERPTAFAEQAREAVRLLTRWLAVTQRAERHDAEPDPLTTSPGAPTPHTPPATFWLLLLVTIAGWSTAAMVWHPVAWLGATLTVVLAWWQWRATAAGTQRALDAMQQRVTEAVTAARDAAAQRAQQERAALEREYNALDVTAPTAWTEEAVLAQMGTLTRDLVQAEREAQRAEAQRAATERRAAAEQRLAVLTGRQQALARTHGVAPELDGEPLVWFVDRLSRWHDAHLGRLAAASQLELAGTRLQQSLHAMGSLCTPVGMNAPASVADAEAAVVLLESRYETYRDAIRARDAAERELSRLAEAAASMQTTWEALFARAGVHATPLPAALNAEGEQLLSEALAALAEVVRHQPQWQRLARRLHEAERDMAQAAQLATEARSRHGGAQVGDVAQVWHALSTHDVRDALTESEAQAAEHHSLVEELTALRHRVADAAAGDTVERALERADRAEVAVADQFAESVQAMVGHVLTEHVRSVARDVDRPAVFHRAKALFARITRGEWQLQLDDATDRDAVFSAVESRTGRPVALANLSGGTRVQLLVAVRVAFVEHEEQEWKLPLLLDETLGTTDDVRAHAFMDAMLALADDGRQLFYCTAQQDEVDYWRAALAERAAAGRPVSCTEIDMTAVRALPATSNAASERLAERTAAMARSPGGALPAIAEHTHESYGEALGVPPLVPARTPVADTHLWYLLHQLPALHAALSLGTSAWGPMQFYLQQGGTLTVPGTDNSELQEQLAQATRLVRAIEVWHRESAVGVGQPITRAVLLDAPLSDRQREAIGELADTCNGNATAMLTQLEDRAVAGFGSTRIDGLRHWLVEEGLLDERPLRTAEEIRLAMLAVVGGVLDHGAIERLLQSIAQRANAAMETGTNVRRTAD